MAGSFASLARAPLGGLPFTLPEAREGQEPLKKVGRRAAPRLRLSLEAKLVTLTETRRCVVLDVSRTGAQISLAKPLAIGEAGFLRFAQREVFGGVVRESAGRNALEFDEQLSDAEVLDIRRYAESYEADQRKALMQEVREWVMGCGET
ncbi:MAG: PilZ domain-containing protein [Pseudomonadota bacterium]